MTLAAKREDLSQPSPWRPQHGDLAPPKGVVDPETGAPVAHWRVMDLLGRLEANGTITGPMRGAGRVLHGHFRAAALDTLRTAPLIRLPAGTGETPTERVGHAQAQGILVAALGVLAGHYRLMERSDW